ncbi:MAG: hypothetical protein KC506_01645 [Nanoarchaeota archaeon]|nr:hypothetical protein [Nanoarchaeota archaeon]
MFEAFTTGYAWGSPGGLGFFMVSIGIFMICLGFFIWLVSKAEKNKSK